MTIYLKQSTASQEVPLGYFLDSTDGNTEETALTIANTDVKVWKTGATTLANKNSGGATHISNGIYYVVLDATDTNTLGPLVIFVHVAGALPVRLECVVLAANVYDALIGGGDLLDVNVSQFGNAAGTFASGRPEVNTTHVAGTAQTAGDIIGDTNDIQARLPAALVGGRIDANVGAMGTDVLTSTALAASAVTEIQSGLATSAAVAAVQADTDDIQSRLPAALVGGRMDASVGAMAANTLTASALATDAVDEIVDAVWDEPLVGHATAGSTGAALSAAGSAGDPWSTPLPGAYGAGTAGNIIGNNLDAAVSTRLAGASYTAPLDAAGTRSAVGLASANLDTQLSGIQSDTNDIQARLPATLVGGRMDASVGAMAANTLTASALAADAVTEVQSGLATSSALATVDGKADAILADTAEIGVAGAGLTALASAANLAVVAGYLDTEIASIKSVTDKVDPMLVLQSGGLYQFTENALALAPSGGSTPAEIADAVWDELLAGHAGAGSAGAALSAAGSAGDPWSTPLPGAYGAGTAGNIIGNNIDAAVSSRASAANLATVAGYIDTEVADIQARLPAALVGGRMDASVGAMAADVVTASAVAASAVTEIQSGLASQTSVDTLAGYVDTEVAAIKAQTDKLTFNASNAVKANITHVIDDAVQQNGSTTTNWGGTP